MATNRDVETHPSHLMWIAIGAAATLVLFLTFACDEARPAGILAAALWIPLIYGIFRTIKGHHVLAIGVVFPIAQLCLIGTLLLACPGSGGRSVLAIGLVGFLIFGLVWSLSVGSLEKWSEEEGE